MKASRKAELIPFSHGSLDPTIQSLPATVSCNSFGGINVKTALT
jgi:hypothetical protein